MSIDRPRKKTGSRRARPAIGADRGEPSAGCAGLYRLEAGKAPAGASHSGGATAIVTPAEQWACGLMVPLDRDGLPQDRAFCLRISAIVHDGCVDFGVLTADERAFHPPVPVSRSSLWNEIELHTPPLAEAGPLIIRNASPAGASRVQCRITGIVPVGPTCEAASADRAIIADRCRQVLAAAGFLGAALEGGAPGDALGPFREPLAATLSKLLASLGVAVLDASPVQKRRVFAALSEVQAIELGTAMAAPPPLGTVPGWQFGSYETSRELATHVRASLWLDIHNRGAGTPVVVPWYENTRLALHFDNDLSRAVYIDGCFEPNEFAFLERVLRPGMTFLDGGANEGVYTVFASARVGPEGQVIAVEPSRRELDRLRCNLALNKARNVEVVEAALAEDDGRLQLTLAEPMHAGHNTLGAFIYEGVHSAGRQAVTAVTIDGLVERFALARLDAVKLDLEGAELRALTGAQRTLRELRPVLLLELSDAALRHQGGSQSALLRLLEEANYAVLVIDRKTGRPVSPASPDGPLSDNIIAVPAEGRAGCEFSVAEAAQPR